MKTVSVKSKVKILNTDSKRFTGIGKSGRPYDFVRRSGQGIFNNNIIFAFELTDESKEILPEQFGKELDVEIFEMVIENDVSKLKMSFGDAAPAAPKA